MDNNADFFDGSQTIEWWNSYTTLHMQDIFCIDPRKKNACLYFRPQYIEAKHFYHSCSIQILEVITKVQLHLLVDCCRAFHCVGRRPSAIFFKIEARIIPSVIYLLLSIFDELKSQRIEIILDINMPSLPQDTIYDEVYRNLYRIVDSGHMVCMGGYDWKNCLPTDLKIPYEVFKYFRLGPPPANVAEINHFMDTCFYVKEKYSLNLILDRIQSKTELDVACRAPYYALMGEYLSPVLLVKDTESIYTKVTP